MNNNIRVANKINNKKLGIYNISDEIVNFYSGASYKIKILKDDNNFYSKGVEYNINFTLIKNQVRKFGKN